MQRGVATDAYRDALLAKKWDTWGPEVVRITWDGHERLLTAATSPTPPLSAPNQWKTVVDRTFDSREEAIMFAEEFLVDWNTRAV